MGSGSILAMTTMATGSHLSTISSSTTARQVATHPDQHLEVIVRRFQGTVVGRTGSESLMGIGGRVVPCTVLQLPMLPVDVGGIGVCGRDAQVHGVYRLAPPVSCYGCDKFAAFVDAPHAARIKLKRLHPAILP